jgi:hypothetical protein
LAGMEAESSEARSQSICSASPRRSRRTRCSLSHTPASCHSFKRRQQVIPEPQPISFGSISQGIPLFSTKTIPVRAARSLMRGLPPWGFGGSGGRSGAMVSHSSSVTSSLAMFSCYPLNGFVRLTKHVFKKTLSISSAELLGSVHALEARKGMGIRSSWGRSVTRGPAVLTSVCVQANFNRCLLG